MDSGPCVQARVGPRARADAPDDEFIYAGRALEDVGVVAVQAPLHRDGRSRTGRHPDEEVVSRAAGRLFVVLDVSVVLEVVQDASNELSLIGSGGRVLSADTLDCTSQDAALVELGLVQTMIAKQMSLRLDGFGEVFNASAQRIVPGARDDGGRMIRRIVLSAVAAVQTSSSATSSISPSTWLAIKIGSRMFAARCLTTGTATPSPVRWYASL